MWTVNKTNLLLSKLLNQTLTERNPFKLAPEQLPPFPKWLRNPVPKYRYDELIKKMPLQGMTTVCDEAKCPNRGECISRGIVTVMILGDQCTRACTFCAVEREDPIPPDPNEPQKMLDMVNHMGVKYLVITAPTRDDLFDGGASHFRKVVEHVKAHRPDVQLEVLIPDFQNQESSFDEIIAAKSDMICFDIQTVKSLYPYVRPGFSYEKGLEIFQYFHKNMRKLEPASLVQSKADSEQTQRSLLEVNGASSARINTAMEQASKIKSGIMVGLGETKEEMIELFHDLYNSGVRYVTVGQYLKPPSMSLPVVEYVEPEVYEFYTQEAEKIGLKIQASPFTRSSYLADRLAKTS